MNNYDDYCTKLFGEHSCTKEDCPNCPTAKIISEHDSELLDKVAEKFISWDSKVKGIREDGVCFFTIENILKGIEELKAEIGVNK